ncbi:sensor histidine kinase [Granulicoccus phenolivorans]|uniref:sensor histidine kinase n=1 Tax=Granulicoccus phenolivorans TaxID=266854 RepID=UPI0004187B74|nr:HAMP domain-containing sensor histidine kinase [Granulicoccus phenolivorans]
MRTRVLLPLLIFGLLTICAILVPAGGSIAAGRTQQLALQRANSMDQIGQRAQAAIAAGEPAVLQRYLQRFFDTYGERVLVVDNQGAVLASVGGLAPTDHIADLVLGATRAVPQWSVPAVYPWSADTVLVAEPLLSEGSTVLGAVVLEINQTAAKRDIIGGWILVGLTGAGLLAVLLLASISWTRWVLRPVRALDRATQAVAERRVPDLQGTPGPPELRRLADSFVRMARGVEDALEQQRGLVADASHQLRNPLAALRYRVDGLRVGLDTGHDPTGTDLDAMDHDLDRLERTVERLLVLADAEHRATEIAAEAAGPGADADVGCVVSADALAAPHRRALHEAGIELVTSGAEIRVAGSCGDIEEIVEILLDNARKYAGSGATVWVGLDRAGDVATLEIADSGTGLTDEELARVGTRFWRASRHTTLPGTGLGYAIITQLARANHAEVEVGRADQGGLRTRIRLGAR